MRQTEQPRGDQQERLAGDQPTERRGGKVGEREAVSDVEHDTADGQRRAAGGGEAGEPSNAHCERASCAVRRHEDGEGKHAADPRRRGYDVRDQHPPVPAGTELGPGSAGAHRDTGHGGRGDREQRKAPGAPTLTAWHAGEHRRHEKTRQGDEQVDRDRGEGLVSWDRSWSSTRVQVLDQDDGREMTHGQLTTNISEWGLALPVAPCGQFVRSKLTQGVPSFSSMNERSSVSLPSGLNVAMQTLWLPSTPVRATK